MILMNFIMLLKAAKALQKANLHCNAYCKGKGVEKWKAKQDGMAKHQALRQGIAFVNEIMGVQ